MPVGVSSSNLGSAGTTLDTSPAVNTQATGSTGVVGVVGDTGFFTSITDTINGAASGNTWTQIETELADGTSANASRMYYCQNMNGGNNHVFRLNKASGSFACIVFVELTTMLTSGALDQSGRQLDTASPFDSTSETTLQPNEVLVACSFADDAGSNTYVAGNSFTIQSQQTNGATSWTGAIATRVVTGTGSYNSTFTRTGAARVHSWIATFIEDTGVNNMLAWIRA